MRLFFFSLHSYDLATRETRTLVQPCSLTREPEAFLAHHTPSRRLLLPPPARSPPCHVHATQVSQTQRLHNPHAAQTLSLALVSRKPPPMSRSQPPTRDESLARPTPSPARGRYRDAVAVWLRLHTPPPLRPARHTAYARLPHCTACPCPALLLSHSSLSALLLGQFLRFWMPWAVRQICDCGTP